MPLNILSVQQAEMCNLVYFRNGKKVMPKANFVHEVSVTSRELKIIEYAYTDRSL